METKNLITSKVEAVVYDELGEGLFVYGILSPDINGEEFVKALNAKIEPFNNDVELFNEKATELQKLHGVNLSMLEITGEELLNEREPKYPATTPLGFKNVQDACPDITIERNRRKLHNERLQEIRYAHIQKATEKFEIDILPFKTELGNKWPEFKSNVNSRFSYEMRIYYPFRLTKFKNITI